MHSYVQTLATLHGEHSENMTNLGRRGIHHTLFLILTPGYPQPLPSLPYFFLLEPSPHGVHATWKTQPCGTAASSRTMSQVVQQSIREETFFSLPLAHPWSMSCNARGPHSPPGALFLLALPSCCAQPSTPPQTCVLPGCPPCPWPCVGLHQVTACSLIFT